MTRFFCLMPVLILALSTPALAQSSKKILVLPGTTAAYLFCPACRCTTTTTTTTTSTSTSSSSSTSSSTSTSSTTTTTQGACFTATNNSHYLAGRATYSYMVYYAKGSGESLGSSSSTTTKLRQTGTSAYKVDASCP